MITPEEELVCGGAEYLGPSPVTRKRYLKKGTISLINIV
jgi:hypothetical protein